MRDHLLHPELFGRTPLVGDILASRVNQAAATTAAEFAGPVAVSVVIRTLNEAPRLAELCRDIERQRVDKLQLIVVDNGSSDRTLEIARKYDAEIITIPRNEFSYPLSMNKGIEAADYQNVFLTVGHARLSNDQTLAASARFLERPNVAGVFARTLPGSRASRTERVISMGNLFFVPQNKLTTEASLGVMAAQGAAIEKQVWQELGGYSEEYGSGGEDTKLAARMLAAGYDIVEDAALAVHHTHGLGPINTVKQWIDWMQMVRGPRPFDREKLAKRRPDLNFK